MSRTTVLPPQSAATADGVKLGGWWHESDDFSKVVCDLCPRGCSLPEGQRGFCFVRQNRQGQMVTTTYGRSTGFCIDPIEKKPLNHFYPGSSVLSFGTAGCNLGCKFCQNWEISKSREIDALGEKADPETVARAARQLGCRSVAFTYNDPVVWAEYAIDCAGLPRGGHQDRGGDGGLHHALGPQDVLCGDGRGKRGPQGLHGGFLSGADQRASRPGAGHAALAGARDERVAGSDHLLIPGKNDYDDDLKRMCGVAGRGPGSRRAAAFHGLPSRLPHARRAGYAARHLARVPMTSPNWPGCTMSIRETSAIAPGRARIVRSVGKCSSSATATT